MISLDTLKNMKIFAADPKQRDVLLQDNTLIDGLVLLLAGNELLVTKLTLEIFLLLAESHDGKEVLKRNDYLLIQMEETVRSENIEIVELAEKFLNLLRDNPTFPQTENIYKTPKNQRSASSQHRDHSSRSHKYKTIVFQLKGLLDKHDRELCTCLLVKVKGVVSIIFDMNRSRCTVRTLPKVQSEVLISFGNDKFDGSYDGPDYLDEVDSPQVDNQAMCRNEDLSQSSSSSLGNWFHKATSFLTSGFW